MSLDAIRREIDDIDREILALFIRRMDAAREVANIKSTMNTPVLNSGRENEILSRVSSGAGQYSGGARVLFQTLMDISRSLQHNILGGGKTLRDCITNADQRSVDSLSNTRIVCQGVLGSYSSAAASRIFPHSDPVFCKRFEDVFLSLLSGESDFGILPVENSSAGSVTEVYDLLIKYRFFIVGATDLAVSNNLLTVPGAAISDITEVYSHPQALAQCSDFLATLNVSVKEWSNTAAAAEMVAALGDQSKAAIASKEAGERYNLNILRSSIQNNSNNRTRFVVIARHCIIPPDASKISLVFSLPHLTGSLYRTLSRFAVYGLNLTKIESRPTKEGNFEYFFYLDFSGSVQNEQTLNLLCALSDDLPQFTFLGNYPDFPE